VDPADNSPVSRRLHQRHFFGIMQGMEKLFDKLFGRSQSLSMGDLKKRQDSIDKDRKSLTDALTMEDEVYSRDVEAAEQYRDAIFEKVCH